MKRSNAGFTLLEVVVAFVLMAGAVGALLRLFGTGIQSADIADQYSKAVTLAESRLAQATTEGEVQPGDKSGEWEGTPFKWRETITEFPDPVPPDPTQPQNLARVQLLQVSVEVSWGEAGASIRDTPRTVRLTTLKLVPKKV